MKKILFISFTALFFLTASCSDSSDDTPVTPELSQQEKDDILFLREEEKLARDVYLYAFDLYGTQVFYNIATRGEQSHMDQVLTLIEKYSLTDPASSERGVFVNNELQELYNSLTEKADLSLQDALIVGATIEDLDIRDIEIFEDRTEKTDFLAVYNALRCGSRNHMRSFDKQLIAIGVNYEPQFISQEEYDEIVNSTGEKCGQ